MKRIFVSLATIIILVICLEIVLYSKSSLDKAENCYRYDEVRHHTFIPNSTCSHVEPEGDVDYHINSLGLRDEEIPIYKSAQTYRIIMLGNSL